MGKGVTTGRGAALRISTAARTRAAEQFGGLRGRPKWPEAPGVCKFRLIEKNDEVPGYLPRVHFQPLFLFRCVLPEWPLGRAACTAIYIRARWNGLSLFLSSLSPLSFSRSLILEIHPLPTRRSYATLVRASNASFSISLLFFLALFTCSLAHSLACSLAAVPPRIYTLFSASNCLSLGAARGSTYERSRDGGRRDGSIAQGMTASRGWRPVVPGKHV